MPGALRRIRANLGPNRDTPIFAFTADADSANGARLRALDFDGVISKPMEPGVLFAAIASAIACDR